MLMGQLLEINISHLFAIDNLAAKDPDHLLVVNELIEKRSLSIDTVSHFQLLDRRIGQSTINTIHSVIISATAIRGAVKYQLRNSLEFGNLLISLTTPFNWLMATVCRTPNFRRRRVLLLC